MSVYSTFSHDCSMTGDTGHSTGALANSQSPDPSNRQVTALLLFLWPMLVTYFFFLVLIIVVVLDWLWSAALIPVNLDWLTPVTRGMFDSGWWTLASERVAAQSTWVLPSALATVIGICAAIYAMPNPTQAAYRELSALAMSVAALTSLWAWIAVPAIALSRNPAPSIGGIFISLLVCVMAVESRRFLRSTGLLRVEVTPNVW
jgi:hypothetical protein